MEPDSAQALTDIINTVEPVFRNVGEFSAGGALGSTVYAATRSAVSTDTIYEASTSMDTAAAGIVSGLSTAAGNPIDGAYVQNAMEYVGAIVSGGGIGAIGGPVVKSWGQHEPFYQNWTQKAQRNIWKGAASLPAAYGVAEWIQNM